MLDATAFERALGDPFVPGAPLSFADTVDRDEREEWPADAVARLCELGFHRLFVPARWGGALTSFEALLPYVRAVARRDPTTALVFGTGLLGALPVWLWGSDAQRAIVGELTLDRNIGAFAMSERAHGSDLFASEVSAIRTDGGWILDGEKWPIGNAARGAFMTVLGRTSAGGGPRGFSLFLVDKRTVDGAQLVALPPVKVLGARGHDVSGVRFERCVVAGDALLGREGLGLDQTLKTLQITRALVAALSLGAADAGLRIAARWARERRLYGDQIAALPAVRQLLLGAFLDVVACEQVTQAALRAITVAPERLALWSAVVKVVAPELADRALRDAAVVLSARHLLREGVAGGAFQKIQRDHAIASVFDGTSLVNLQLVASQLPAVVADRTVDDEIVAALFDRRSAAPPWDPDHPRLRVSLRGGDPITSAIPGALARLRDEGAAPPIVAAVERLEAARAALDVDVEALGATPARASAAAIDLARRHALLHAGAACVLGWIHGRAGRDGREAAAAWFADGRWLAPCLDRLAGRPVDPASAAAASLVDALFGEAERNAPFSAWPAALE